jgi:hypothetical protein
MRTSYVENGARIANHGVSASEPLVRDVNPGEVTAALQTL